MSRQQEVMRRAIDKMNADREKIEAYRYLLEDALIELKHIKPKNAHHELTLMLLMDKINRSIKGM